VAAHEFAEMVLAGDMMGFAYAVLLAVGSIFIVANLAPAAGTRVRAR
jgi:hypothetical protein